MNPSFKATYSVVSNVANSKC